MPGLRVTHVLFDFFGTLVDHSPCGAETDFTRSHDLTRTLGAALTYEEFLAAWSKASERFTQLSDVDNREYSMTDIGTAFLRDALGCPPARADVDQLVRTYLSEWNKGVRHLPGIGDLLTAMAGEYRLAVVSNTQEADLVPGHLEAMGVRQLFDAVVTSFEVGWRKPHPAIYTAALNELGIAPATAVFVGDTYEADYRGPLQAGIRSLLIDPHSHMARGRHRPGRRRGVVAMFLQCRSARGRRVLARFACCRHFMGGATDPLVDYLSHHQRSKFRVHDAGGGYSPRDSKKHPEVRTLQPAPPHSLRTTPD